VLARAGQTEAAVDLARLAGLHPSGVICENYEQGRHHGPGAATQSFRTPAQNAVDHRRGLDYPTGCVRSRW